MFEFVRTHTRILQFMLVLLIFPSFVFFGVQGYATFAEGARNAVGEVDGKSISGPEFESVHQKQVEAARRQNPGLDAKTYDTPAARAQTLDVLVRERVLRAAARDLHLSVSDERLAALFASDPQFAPLRNADGSVNKDLLATQGMTSEGFASQLRQDLATQQVMRGVLLSGLAPASVAGAALDPLLQRREVSYLRLDAKDYVAQVKPTDADIEAYYKGHDSEFRTTEQATIEYVSVDVESLKKGVTVNEEELKRYYAENISRYAVTEERRARHILIKSDAGAAADARQKARALAEAVLAEVRKAPATFAEVAAKKSQDEGSAGQGGDLDFFARGAMVKPFDDAAFAMKPGEISNLVESEFGFHIIKLEAVRGGDKKPFDQVRPAIEDEVRKQLASKRWAEVAEQFSTTVYEQYESLQPVMDKLKLEKQTAVVQRVPAPGVKGVLGSAKLLEAVFGNESVRNKRNTDAVEIGPNQLASARVVLHQPARVLPLPEVRERVRERVVAEQAAAAARKEGEARLASLRTNLEGTLKDRATLSRMDPQGMPRVVMDAVLKADAGKLPVALGVDLAAAGYLVARVERVLPRQQSDAETKLLQGQYGQAFSQAEAQAYYEALKARYKVTLTPVRAPDGAASAAAR